MKTYNLLPKIRSIIIASLFTVVTFLTTNNVIAQLSMDVETGIVSTGYNDVRIPGSTGTFFSLNEDLQAQAIPYFRLRGLYTFCDRHTVSLLYAPLKVESSGSVDFPIQYQGSVFDAGAPINALYKFNSYRLTYRYRLIDHPKFNLGLGFTVKIRDAEIALESGGITSSKVNVGFVPILNFRTHWMPTEKLGVLLWGDALAAPQGRAEDVQLALTYAVNEQMQLRAGYRILEGGADNAEVYNFALFHFASIGAFYEF